MKRRMLSFLSGALLCIMPQFVQSQSTLEFQSGTTIEVTTGADICVDIVIMNGTNSWTGTQCGGPLTNVEEIEDALVPREFRFSQNYPNPFNPTTVIEFTVPNDGNLVLKVYNSLGQVVATLFDGEAVAGRIHQVNWDASSFATGTYFSKLQFEGKEITNKMLLMK